MIVTKREPQLIRHVCDWCGDAQEDHCVRAPLQWFNLIGPYAIGAGCPVQLLCEQCGARAVLMIERERAALRDASLAALRSAESSPRRPA